MTSPCLDKAITIKPHDGRVRVHFAGRVVADTVNALDLDEPGSPLRIYVPRADVDAAVLAASDHHTSCPYKGEASYHSLQAEGQVAANAVWYYPDPCALVEPIRDHVAFWGNQIRYELA